MGPSPTSICYVHSFLNAPAWISDTAWPDCLWDFNFNSAISSIFFFICGFVTAIALICWPFARIWMSESASSDTTHEAILHNLVAHQAALKRQISQVHTDLQFVKDQLSLILDRLQFLSGPSGNIVPNFAEADRGSRDNHAERSGR